MEVIIDFIALDKPQRALDFFEELILKIKNVPQNPYIFRKQKKSKDEFTRELIYKGYTIPFYIDIKQNKIIILGIFNQNLWE